MLANVADGKRRDGPPQLVIRSKLAAVQRRIDRAAAVVTVSQFTADDVRCHLDLKGKPVFLSRATSLPEIAGNKGFSFGSHEPESMAQVFHDGMARMDKTVRFADILRSPAASFLWASAAKRYAEVYGTVLASST